MLRPRSLELGILSQLVAHRNLDRCLASMGSASNLVDRSSFDFSSYLVILSLSPVDIPSLLRFSICMFFLPYHALTPFRYRYSSLSS